MVTPTRLNQVRTGGAQNRTQDNVARIVEPTVSAVQATPIMGAKPPNWIPFTILTANGWAALGGGNAVPAFHKDALGYVHVKGAWLNTSGGGNSAKCAQLPMGYRPAETNDYPVSVSGGNCQALIITPDGFLQPDTAILNNGHMHTSFSFLAAQ